MKAVIAHRSGEPRVVQLPEPPVGERTVVIRVSHTALMLPEELEIIPRAAKKLKKDIDGLPLGAMCSGIVDQVGSVVKDLKPGLRVAAFGSPYVYHASVLSVPASLVVELPKKVNHEEGAFAGQGALALNLFRASGVALGETVVIFGAGMTGVLAAQIARAAGAVPLLVDSSENRLTKARNVGISQTVKLEKDVLVKEVDRLTGGQGADAAIVTADASPKGGGWATLLLRWGGRIVVNGPGGDNLAASMLADKELSLVAISTAGAGHGEPAYERDGVQFPRGFVRWTVRDNMLVFLNLLAERKVQISPLITERTPLERAPHVYNKIQRSEDGVIGAVLTI